MFKNACRTCSTIILVFSTNNITAFWRCRCRSRCRFLNSQIRISVRWPIYIINSVDKTKFSKPQLQSILNYFNFAHPWLLLFLLFKLFKHSSKFKLVIFSLCYAWFGCQFPIAESGFIRYTAPLNINSRIWKLVGIPSRARIPAGHIVHSRPRETTYLHWSSNISMGRASERCYGDLWCESGQRLSCFSCPFSLRQATSFPSNKFILSFL